MFLCNNFVVKSVFFSMNVYDDNDDENNLGVRLTHPIARPSGQLARRFRLAKIRNKTLLKDILLFVKVKKVTLINF